MFEGKENTALKAVIEFACETMGKEHFYKIKKGTHPDLIFLPKISEKKSIGVDEIRDLQKKAIFKPIEANMKIYVIKKASTLTEQAQNSLLKFLEEPPSNVIVCLVCENSKNLLPTILSRIIVLTGKTSLQVCSNSRLSEVPINLCLAMIEKNKFDATAVLTPFLKNRDTLRKIIIEACFEMVKKCKEEPKFINLVYILKESYILIEKNVNINLISCFITCNL
ncbi:MAG: hypothetical protein LBP36_03970 [Oscillospiraceae bacterium]|nr:hypothetical protein [Oscillospiraceae bacterium]